MAQACVRRGSPGSSLTQARSRANQDVADDAANAETD